MKVLLAVEGSDDARRVPLLLKAWLTSEERLHDERALETCGLTESAPYVKISTIPKVIKKALGTKMGTSGKFGGGDGRNLRKLHLLLHELKLRPDAVVWVRDSDGDDNRLSSARDARAESKSGIPTCIGLARQCSEAWLIAGHPEAPKRVEKLTHKGPLGGAKAVWKKITEDNGLAQEADCLRGALTSSQSKAVGLDAFIEELKNLPFVTSDPSTTL